MDIIKKISDTIGINRWQVESVEKLLSDGATVPFISRYRKEATGELDEVAVLNIKNLLEKLNELEKRKAGIIKSLRESGNFSDELKKAIDAAESMAKLEDIYLPYKPKRKTRGVKAKEAGLEPLSDLIIKGREFHPEKYLSKEYDSVEKVLSGAKDIIAEKINEDGTVREKLRDLFTKRSDITAKVVRGKKDEAEKYKDYFNYSEQLSRAPSHRILAILRGVNEGVLKLGIEPDPERALSIIDRRWIRGNNSHLLKEAGEDSYKRLLKPSLETEMKNMYKEKADEKAIDVFSENLKVLLLAPPLGEKSLLAIDPGLRTGCKVVSLDKNGNYLENCVIKPLSPFNDEAGSEKKIKYLINKYSLEAVAIGNGTGGREVEKFCKSLNLTIPVIMTNESGASIYSASECAREEFPDLDLTVRGAVSIGRRLMDPLAELVKIDPKSIGVGQYQHDVNQKSLKESLNDCVISCVNSVGVEVNTASKELLSYVAGLNKSSAKNIVEYRLANGGIKNRKELLKVKGVGAKAYEQAAGFVKVNNSKNILDKTSVHPESYWVVELMAKDKGVKVEELINNSSLRESINIKEYVNESIGLPTLKDIMSELSKPGRDPRDEFELFSFDDSVNSIDDLYEGVFLPGIVTNVTAFGAFVDIGVHQDGLVHISQLSNGFVKDPGEIVKTGEKVKVRVVEVDKKRKRISLSMKDQ